MKLIRTDSGLVVQNVNVVDVVSGGIANSVNIHIEGQLIVDIVNATERERNTSPGQVWAMPGLIDSHVHLFEIHSGANKGLLVEGETYADAEIRALRNLNTAINVGITTVRDMASFGAYNNRLRDNLEKQRENPFRVISSGRHITRIGGHFWDRGVVYDPSKFSLSDMVDEELRNGADFIKIMNDDPIFDEKELAEVALRCRERGVIFACHAYSDIAFELALNSLPNTIEHSVPVTKKDVSWAIDHNIAFCPTFIAALDSIGNVPCVLQAFPDCSEEDLRGWKEKLEEQIPIAFGTDAKIIAGTDAGTVPTGFDSLPKELRAFTQFGASNLRALQSATRHAASAIGIGDVTGELRTGLSADIILSSHNPMDDLNRSLASIALVISRGQVVRNDFFSEALG